MPVRESRIISACGMFCKLVLLFIVFTTAASARPLSRIRFEGLLRSEETFVVRLLKSKAGEQIDLDRLEADAQRLRNTHLFSRVEVRVESSKEGEDAVFKVEEVLTLIPIVRLGVIKDSFFLQLGATENHFAGKGITLSAYYQYYDRHSVALLYRDPFFFSSQWGWAWEVGSFSTLEPLDPRAFGSAVSYEVDRRLLLGFLRYEPSAGDTLELGGGGLFEKYKKRSGVASAPEILQFEKPSAKLRLTRDRRNFRDGRIEGFRISLNPEVVYTLPDDSLFGKQEMEWIAHRLVASQGNFGLRLKVGLATNEDTPYPPFVIDSQLNVRGAGNRVRRGTAELTLNLGYDHTVARARWLTLQLGAFLDFSTVRTPGQGVDTLFAYDNQFLYGGTGLRFLFPDLYHAILRLDWGINLRNVAQNGVVIGTGRYF